MATSSDADTSVDIAASPRAEAAAADVTDAEAELCEKFNAFCDVKKKNQFTPTACSKLVKTCFEEHYKFPKVILSNRIDSSAWSKCKERDKPHMVVSPANCEKFLRRSAIEIARIKKKNSKLPEDDPLVEGVYADLKDRVTKSTGPKVKAKPTSKTGNVGKLTDTKAYTGSHKLRFDESGKGRGKAGRVDKKGEGYVANYKGAGTFDADKDKADQ